MYQVTFQPTIRSPWTEMKPVRLGAVPTGLGTPDGFLTLEKDAEPRLRVDVYGSGNQSWGFEDLQIWDKRVVLGWGDYLYLVNAETGTAGSIELDSPYVQMHMAPEHLLVTSARRMIRVGLDGQVLWTSDCLGIDGVIVERVADGIVWGSGEWDPPGGWRPFRLLLETGQPV
jgi:hypothetical protein